MVQESKVKKPYRIRVANFGDYEAVSQIAGDVFAAYGDYSEVLPGYMFFDNVHTFVCEVRTHVVGFIQLGFVSDAAQGGKVVADVLAVGLLAEFRHRGLGKALFQRVFDEMEQIGPSRGLFDLWLTVAHTNTLAIDAFSRLGFVLHGETVGIYEGGQQALRMRRSMEKGDDG